MKNSVAHTELKIPDFVTVESRLKCSNCQHCCGRLTSKYDCRKFLTVISTIKIIFEILLFSAITVFSCIYFSNFWRTILTIAFTFTFLLTSDILSDKLINFLCVNSEKNRRKKYDMKVQKLKEENEAIRRARAGVTEEVKKFLDYSNSLFNELTATFDSIKSDLNMDSKEEKRVVTKFQDTLKELEILNSKLLDNNFESTYLSTLYEIHLPKLLEYSNQFLLYLKSNILTSKQIVEFSNLLEVFRVKISTHTEHFQKKVEDDFIIKMKALNDDVLPDFNGSEVKNDECE